MRSLRDHTTEWLHFHFSLACIGEGNGNPLQCSCLENPMDREAWWAAVYGVAQSRTQLKRLSSSRSSIIVSWIIIFMLAVLNLCHLSWHLFIIFTYLIWDILVLGMMSSFPLKPGHVGSCIIRFWILFKSCVFAGSSDITLVGDGDAASWLWGGDGSSGSLLSLHWPGSRAGSLWTYLHGTMGRVMVLHMSLMTPSQQVKIDVPVPYLCLLWHH